MSNTEKTVKYPNLRGSEQHHDLKNQPGEKGDPDHMNDDGKTTADRSEAKKSDDS